MLEVCFDNRSVLPTGAIRLATVKAIWEKIGAGETVYWGSKAYKITVEPATGDYQASHHTNKDNQVLRVTCISNYFGSLLVEAEIEDCFVLGETS